MFEFMAALSLFASLTGIVPGTCTSYSDHVAVNLTDWSTTVSIPRFDPALGTLTYIDIELVGYLEGQAFYENLESLDTDISLTLSASILLTRPDLSTLLSVAPSVLVMEHPAGFDGAFDFDGDSGTTFAGLSTSEMDFTSSPPPLSDLALFTGLGNILLPISATGDSSGVGPGNWIFGFQTYAGADVNVTYCYVPIPEPSVAALLAFGVVMPVLRRRR